MCRTSLYFYYFCQVVSLNIFRIERIPDGSCVPNASNYKNGGGVQWEVEFRIEMECCQMVWGV